MIELVDKLYKDGSLKKLIKGGLVSPKIMFYREVYLDYDKNIRVAKVKERVRAAEDTADTFKISTAMVYRIVKIMK